LGTDTLIRAARSVGFRVKERAYDRTALARVLLPCLVILRSRSEAPTVSGEAQLGSAAAPVGAAAPGDGAPDAEECRLALVAQVSEAGVLLFRAGTNQAVTLSGGEFEQEFTGIVLQLAPVAETLTDPDSPGVVAAPFD
jgi:hypothetical protein